MRRQLDTCRANTWACLRDRLPMCHLRSRSGGRRQCSRRLRQPHRLAPPVRGRCTMASPYTSVPPGAPLPPPPPTPYRRSLVGPVILILIGLVFLLRNVGVHVPVWHFFGRFWPLLIILWGVFALAEHFIALKHGYQTRGLGGGGILLLIFIVIVGVAAHHSS